MKTCNAWVLSHTLSAATISGSVVFSNPNVSLEKAIYFVVLFAALGGMIGKLICPKKIK